VSLTVRTQLDPMLLASAVQKQVHAIDPQQPSTASGRCRTTWRARSNAGVSRRCCWPRSPSRRCCWRPWAIYGITSYTVAQRSQEMGVRMALGSSRAGILRLVLSRAWPLPWSGGGWSRRIDRAGPDPVERPVRSALRHPGNRSRDARRGHRGPDRGHGAGELHPARRPRASIRSWRCGTSRQAGWRVRRAERVRGPAKGLHPMLSAGGNSGVGDLALVSDAVRQELPVDTKLRAVKAA